MDDNGLEKNPEFKFQPETPRQKQAKRKKLLQIGLTLGTMVALCLILGTAMVAYTIGYQDGQKTKKVATSSSKTQGNQSDVDDSKAAPAEASKLLAQSDVSEGQIPDHYRGNPTAKVIAIEYADYTCPYCQNLHPNLADIYKKYGDKVTFIFRNFKVGHTYSDITAKAAEAAYIVGGEDAYWKFGDKLYDDDVWVDSSYMTTDELNNKLKGYASEVGIDGNKLIDAMNNSANNGIDAKIARDEDLAAKSDVSGTPSWFINRQSVPGVASKIKTRLDNILN